MGTAVAPLPQPCQLAAPWALSVTVSGAREAGDCAGPQPVGPGLVGPPSGPVHCSPPQIPVTQACLMEDIEQWLSTDVVSQACPSPTWQEAHFNHEEVGGQGEQRACTEDTSAAGSVSPTPPGHWARPTPPQLLEPFFPEPATTNPGSRCGQDGWTEGSRGHLQWPRETRCSPTCRAGH